MHRFIATTTIGKTKPRIVVSPILRFVLGLLALGMFCSPDARPQNGDLDLQRAALTKVGQALSRGVVKAKKVNEQLGYGFYEGGCVFGVNLRAGSRASEKFSLQAGQSYVFIGSGDKTARNVDIILRDSNGRIVNQDIEADAAPFMLVQPKQSGRYTLSLSLKSGWRGSAFCAVTILRKGGTALPIERIVEAAIRMDIATFNTFREVGGGAFNETSGTWGLYGAVIGQGQALSSAPKRYGRAHRGIVAVGDSRVRDLDLSLLDGSGKIVAADTKNGAAPKITRKTGAGTYSLRISNQGSSGPALVMAVLLDLPDEKLPAPSPTQNPTPTPTSTPLLSPEPSQTSPFEASPFEGNWADEKKGRNGTFKMRVKADGSVSGHLSYPLLRVAAKFKGSISPDGVFRFNYTQSKQDSMAEGVLKFTDDEHQLVEGKISFLTNTIVFGDAQLVLLKKK